MNGVTGRMGSTQHLVRSIVAIREQGGIELESRDVLWPEPVLLGRDPDKLDALARSHGIERWTTSLEECLADDTLPVYFDAQLTALRAEALRAAIDAGKQVYCEKPLAGAFETALALAGQARQAGVKNGVVQDKLFLPGLLKLRSLVESGFFGRIVTIRCHFGYWVFEGHKEPAQRPSWNYRAEDGGGIILDMFPHWHYVIERLFGRIESVSCLGVTHIPERFDELGDRYAATADDAAYATFLLEEGAVVAIDNSWVTRVYRDDLAVFQVDGTEGSAVAGLRECRIQPASSTPRPVWNPDAPNPFDFRTMWEEYQPDLDFDNAFKAQWELFLRHVAGEGDFPWDFLSGARGVLLAELAYRSWQERSWVDVPSVET